MATVKIELTKRQNNLVATRCKDETLALSAKFGGMCRDYTFWMKDSDIPAIAEAIGEQPKVIVRID